MKAFLNNYRQSPRKVRLVAEAIKGKPVNLALAQLDFLAKKASSPVRALLLSAVNNAKNNFNIEMENLIVKEVRVDGGKTLKRIRPRAMGMAKRINKRTSHISIVLAEKGVAKTKILKKEKKVAEKPKAKKKAKKD